MTIDLTGGLDEELEFVFAEQPADPDMRESVNAWIWDDGGTYGLPRIGIEAVADQWETHDCNAQVAFADGRVLTRFGPGTRHDVSGADGRPRVLGAGPVSIEMLEPYGLLRLRFDGDLALTSVKTQMEQGLSAPPGEPVHVKAVIDLRPAAPPFLNGGLLADAKRVLDTQEEGDLMGHPWRFEQLCRATGQLRVGDEEYEISGGANRIRRQSIRKLASFWGHAWQAALFPSGRGFGYIAYPARPDGKDTYNEGYLFEGDGALIPARVVRAPWLRTLHPTGQDIACSLETEDGRRVDIEGETAVSTFMIMPPEVGGGMQLQQALATYRWDGEQGHGMIERSSLPDAMG